MGYHIHFQVREDCVNDLKATNKWSKTYLLISGLFQCALPLLTFLQQNCSILNVISLNHWAYHKRKKKTKKNTTSVFNCNTKIMEPWEYPFPKVREDVVIFLSTVLLAFNSIWANIEVLYAVTQISINNNSTQMNGEL